MRSKAEIRGPLGKLRFFLGGCDLEMLEIRCLLESYAPDSFADKGLKWGAKLSDYQLEIEAAVASGQTPIPIELADDMPADWPPRHAIVIVDHHGARAGHDRPSSLEQVFSLLDLPQTEWTRRHALVAANDIGHVAGLHEAGAGFEEIKTIRAEDRRAQGVTIADEIEAMRALVARHVLGRLTVVETRSTTSSAIADFLLPELGGPGYDDLLVIMPNKLAFFGAGTTVAAMARETPGSWSGGALPERGYWGASFKDASARDLLTARIENLARQPLS